MSTINSPCFEGDHWFLDSVQETNSILGSPILMCFKTKYLGINILNQSNCTTAIRGSATIILARDLLKFGCFLAPSNASEHYDLTRVTKGMKTNKKGSLESRWQAL